MTAIFEQVNTWYESPVRLRKVKLVTLVGGNQVHFVKSRAGVSIPTAQTMQGKSVWDTMIYAYRGATGANAPTLNVILKFAYVPTATAVYLVTMNGRHFVGKQNQHAFIRDLSQVGKEIGREDAEVISIALNLVGVAPCE